MGKFKTYLCKVCHKTYYQDRETDQFFHYNAPGPGSILEPMPYFDARTKSFFHRQDGENTGRLVCFCREPIDFANSLIKKGTRKYTITAEQFMKGGYHRKWIEEGLCDVTFTCQKIDTATPQTYFVSDVNMGRFENTWTVLLRDDPEAEPILPASQFNVRLKYAPEHPKYQPLGMDKWETFQYYMRFIGIVIREVWIEVKERLSS